MDPQLQWMSQSIIYPLGQSKIKTFYTNKNHWERKIMLPLMRSQPWPVWGSRTHYREGWKLHLPTRMMDDKLNLCPGTEGEWWQRYLSWEWRLGSGDAGCLKAQDVDKFIHWTPPPGPFLCFESSPLAKWPASLMLPMCKEYHAVPGIPPLLPRVLHSSLTHFWMCFFGLLQQLLDSGSVG